MAYKSRGISVCTDPSMKYGLYDNCLFSDTSSTMQEVKNLSSAALSSQEHKFQNSFIDNMTCHFSENRQHAHAPTSRHSCNTFTSSM